MSSLDEVDMESLVRTDSPAGAAAAADDCDNGHHPLRRLFSASVLSSLLGMSASSLAVVVMPCSLCILYIPYQSST